MEHARASLHKIVLDALHRASQEQVPMLAWAIVCGAKVAEKTQALAFERGTLRVAVPDSAWRAQLRDMAPEYLAKLNQVSSTSISKIDFVVAEIHPEAGG